MPPTAGPYGKWINHGPPDQEYAYSADEVKVRLFCIPQAGCGAWAFHGWSKKLPPEIQVMPVELPGRNSRMMDPKPGALNLPVGEGQLSHLAHGVPAAALSQTSMQQLVDDAVQALLPLLDEKPYMLLGHSMGAWVAYEMIKKLERDGQVLPKRIYLCANRPTHLAGAEHDPDQLTPRIGHLPPEQFWPAFERRYGKNPDLQNPNIQSFVIDVLQADFRIIDSYQPSDMHHRPLPCALTAIGAKGDNRYTPEQLAAWRDHTSLEYEEHWFDGKQDPGYWGTPHRFVLDNPEALQQFLGNDIESLIGTRR